jgi:hypothetical protein
MAVRFKNAAGLKTLTNTVIGSNQSKITLAYRLRLNTPPDLPAGNLSSWFISKGNLLYDRLYKAGVAGTQTPQIYIRLGAVGGGAASITPVMNANIVNSIVVVYDKDDPSNQAVYINGVKNLLGSPQTAALINDNNMFVLGATSTGDTVSRDFELEGLLWLNGYCFTADDAAAYTEGVDPTTLGTGATWRGYYPLTGTVGATPASGDAGISNAIDGTWSFTPYVGTSLAGSALTYSASMPFVSQATYETPLVCSSGQSVTLATIVATTGTPLPVTAGSATTMPTISIDGGSPITLERPFYASGFNGIQYYLPPGLSVPKDASVTFSAPDGFFSTSIGTARGSTNVAMVNRSGKPIFGDVPATIRFGYNHSSGPQYWGYEYSPRNWYHRLNFDSTFTNNPTFRTDGTASSNWNVLLNTTNYSNSIDKTGTPGGLGLWMVGYDDNDLAHPTTIVLTGSTPGTVVERTEYRNNGTGGVGIVRVFEVKTVTYGVVLQGGINSTATTLSLDTVANLAGLDFTSTPSQWIRIDDEYMLIQSVNSGAKTIVVTRGAFGTTATSHSALTAATVSYQNAYPQIFFNVSSTTGSPNYSNCVIYGPGDWAVPSPAGPVTLDRSSTQVNGISSFVERSLHQGMGVVRHMDVTLAFSLAAEPEDMRRESDVFWAGQSKKLKKWRFASCRNFNPTNCPYVYSDRDGELFNATLGANITTAPARDTLEWITITDAATAPVFFGLRLIVDDEVMRVTDVSNVDPTQVQVARGSEMTTPATHSAGTIQVRGRIPITNASQYEQVNQAIVEMTLDAPHNMIGGFWGSQPKCPDLNTLARFDVTLTSAVTSATSTVFNVNIASDKWQYVQSGLHILFDNEDVTVVSGNQGAGTITVKRVAASAGATTHSSGVVGKARSSNVFVMTKDGTKYAWQNELAWTTNFQVTGPRSLMMSANAPLGQSLVIPVDQTFDTTPVVVGGVDTTQMSINMPGRALPYSYTARVTARVPGAYHWLNFPFCATNDIVDRIVDETLDNLPAGRHKIVLELANEVWNYAFPYVLALYKSAALRGYTDYVDPWIVRADEIRNRAKARAAARGREAEILLSVPCQQGQVGYVLGRCRALNVRADVCSTAPYFRPGSTSSHIAAWNNGSDEQCNDAWLFDLLYNTNNTGQLLVSDGQARLQHEAAVGYPIEFIHYEGGIDTCTPAPSESITNGYARNLDIMYNPVRYFVEYDYIFALNKLAGSNGRHGVNIFNYCQIPTGPLPVGSGNYYALWGVTEYQGQPAGYGDGSDGKFDNRTLLATPGKAHSKKPWVNLTASMVSPRLQAGLDYMASYAVYNAEAVPTFTIAGVFTGVEGGSYTGSLVDESNVAVSAVVFVQEVANGFFTIKASVPEGHKGAIVVLDASNVVQYMIPVNPSSLENRDLKVSHGLVRDVSRAVPASDLTAKTTQTVGDALGGARAHHAGKMTATTSQILYGPDSSVVRTFTLDDPVNPQGRQ